MATDQVEAFNYNVEEKEDGFYAVVQFNNKYIPESHATQEEGPYNTQEQAERTLEDIRQAVEAATRELDLLFSNES